MTPYGTWRRLGRGRTFSFYATDKEVTHWFNEALPPDKQPYTLVGSEIPDGIGPLCGARPTFEFPVAQLEANLRPLGKARANFFLRSLVLTPTLPSATTSDLDGDCSLSGLVLLQLGYVDNAGCKTCFSLGIVDRIANDATREVLVLKQANSRR